jgi:hypothetical protein
MFSLYVIKNIRKFIIHYFTISIACTLHVVGSCEETLVIQLVSSQSISLRSQSETIFASSAEFVGKFWFR